MQVTFISTVVLQFALIAFAAPLVQFMKRAAGDLQEVATVGYATQNGGTTGGKGGTVVHVSTFDELSAAASGTDPAIIIIDGKISQSGKISVGSNKSIIGAGPQAELGGTGLSVNKQTNIIIRNLKISKVVADNVDAIGVRKTTNVWIDHVDVSSDMDHGKDYYDGLIDLIHAADFITVSNCKIHDHYKASLIGHSDKNAAEDTGHLRVTFFSNYWSNINPRTPSLRFGTTHIFDSVFENVNDGINVRKGAKALVENNSFSGSSKPLYSVDDTGGAVSKNNEFGGAETTITTLTTGTLANVPYTCRAKPIAYFKAKVMTEAGNTLTFCGRAWEVLDSQMDQA